MIKSYLIIKYLINNYPYQDELFGKNGKLFNILYLIDWKMCIDYGTQITNISWYYGNYGAEILSEHAMLMGNELTKNEISIIDHVINVTKDLYYNDFMTLIYSTHPIMRSNRYSDLNLIKFSQEYNKNLAIST